MICSYLITRVTPRSTSTKYTWIFFVALANVSRALLSLTMSYQVLLLFYALCLGLQYLMMNAKLFQTHILKSLLSSGWLFWCQIHFHSMNLWTLHWDLLYLKYEQALFKRYRIRQSRCFCSSFSKVSEMVISFVFILFQCVFLLMNFLKVLLGACLGILTSPQSCR